MGLSLVSRWIKTQEGEKGEGVGLAHWKDQSLEDPEPAWILLTIRPQLVVSGQRLLEGAKEMQGPER